MIYNLNHITVTCIDRTFFRIIFEWNSKRVYKQRIPVSYSIPITHPSSVSTII